MDLRSLTNWRHQFGRAAGYGGVLAVLINTGCQIGGADKLPPVGEARVDVAHKSCIAKGGEFIRDGQGNGFFCSQTPLDAGKSCSAASDCQSACLARSRSCAPVKPLLGCNEVLTNSGVAVTECVN